jgi:hypothetical protein
VGSSTEVAPAPQNSTAPHPELGGPIAEPEAALPTGPVNPHLTLLGFSLFDLTCTQPAALQDWVANCRVAKSRDNEVDAPSVIVVDDHDLQVLREFAGDDNLMALAQEEFYELLLTSSIALEDVCEAGVPAPASATPGAADTDQVAPDATQAPRKAVHATRQSPPSTVADAERALETFLDTPDEFFRIPAAHREYARALRAELADFASEAERSRDPIRRELYRMAGQITYEMQLAVPYIGHPQRVRHSDLAIDLGNLSPAQYVELRRQQILKVFSQIAGQRRRRR